MSEPDLEDNVNDPIDSDEEDEDIDLLNDEGETDEDESDQIVSYDQWVKTIEATSFRSNLVDAVRKNLGVEKLCQTNDQSDDLGWILINDHREETLTVSFEQAVFINEILVHESLNSGSVVKLEMFESERKKFWTMWQRKSSETNLSEKPIVFNPHLRRYRIRSKTIRLTFDPRHADRFGIRTIQLRGSNQFDTSIDQISISRAMKTLFDEAMNQIDTDVQFRFGDIFLHAHRNILTCRSSYFRALLTNNFSEKFQCEPIELTDVDEETFVEILHFLYVGQFSSGISFDIALRSMFYANKINMITAKNSAIEMICFYLRVNHQEILPTYLVIKPYSTTFDLLLDYIYELCTEYFSEISRQEQFNDLDKEFILDLVCQIAQRQEILESKRQLERQTEQILPEDDSSDDGS